MAATADILAFVLDGLADYLELERELGVRAIEVDRSLLGTGNGERPPSSEPRPASVAAPTPHATERSLDFIFVADRPLSPKAIEIMAKIVPALGRTPETAPVVVAPPFPNARFFVFLGRAALAKYMPGLRGEENRWLRSPKGKDVLLVTSPEEIVRFATVTPALKKMKQDMWLALKTLRQRVQLGM